ncbi:MAG: Fpg/Nei family DNA glycosylase [Limisphaerales bacterium]
MPELAEVEYYRKQWDCGLQNKVQQVHLHPTKRIFRRTDTSALSAGLSGATLLGSEAHGKQMLFRFSGGAWIGLHLGMSGKLRVESSGFEPAKHDHFALRQARQTLVFSDPRQFGRVLFHSGKDEPSWWRDLPPRINSTEFTYSLFKEFIRRHRKAPIKAVLLLQERFPGVGNWMADEILWQSNVHPGKPPSTLNSAESKRIFENTIFVCAEALKTIGKDFSDPPPAWLFQHRWRKGAACPRCEAKLSHTTIGGRTSCWCKKCQR